MKMPLDPRRILSVGMPAGPEPVHTAKFFDSFNVDDFQLIVWHADSFVIEIQETTGCALHDHYHPFVYRTFKELYDKKMTEILRWIGRGHVFVIFPCLFNVEMTTDGPHGLIHVDINQFQPFDSVKLAPVSVKTARVLNKFRREFAAFTDMLRCDLALSGDDIIPLFRTSKSDRKNCAIVGAALRVGKGVIVFSPPPKVWGDVKLLEYWKALAKLPTMLSRPGDPLSGRTSVLQRPALWLAGLTAAIMATIAGSPFWAPQVERLFPWGERMSVSGENYSTLAARLTEIEKQVALLRLDINAVKSAESASAPRVDQLEVTLSRLQKLSVARSTTASDPPPSARPHHSTEETAALLARGDEAFKTGDVASARLFYEYVADAGNRQAALRMGATFDPAFLGSAALGGVRGDLGEASRWYRRAYNLGEAEAAQRLRRLEAK